MLGRDAVKTVVIVGAVPLVVCSELLHVQDLRKHAVYNICARLPRKPSQV